MTNISAGTDHEHSWRPAAGSGTYDLGMTPEEIGARFAELLGGTSGVAPPVMPPGAAPPAAAPASRTTGDAPVPSKASSPAVGHSLSGGGDWARATVEVPPGDWRAAITLARDDAELAMDFFDWLSAVDELEAGFDVIVHLWSTTRRHGVLVVTRLPERTGPAVDSIVDIFPGAAWHERETHEMFGIRFPGHDEELLRPLLLPPEFEGHPLRKDFVLATRVAKPWPGAKEPGESGHSPTKRQPMRPPGVPDPREWGPGAGGAETATAPAKPAGERSARSAERPGRPERPERPERPAGDAAPTERTEG